MRRLAALFVCLVAAAAAAAPAVGADARLAIGYLGLAERPATPASPLDAPAEDEGLAGARLGIEDNATTGRFTGQSFTLEERRLPADADVADAIRELRAAGVRLVIADLLADALLQAADAGRAGGITLLNARATDDRLRNEDCRANLLHTAPSRAMLADGLAQYLVLKQWQRWLLVTGQGDGDRQFAADLRRSADRFGAKIVAEKPWTFRFGPGRADSGHVGLQTEIPIFTRAGEHDVLVVADEEDVFGEYLPGRTALPRPVAGTHGLTACAWSPVHEQWGAAQLQARFRRASGRAMTSRDYTAWLAARAIGEASLRSGSSDPEIVGRFLRSPDFVLAGFKGQGLSFRDWDGQLRQPILIAGPKLLISVSPQPGFLHPGSELDTLGHDRAESRCRPSG